MEKVLYALILFTLCGCYHNCEPPFPYAPALSTTDYNYCASVVHKYGQPVKKMKDYPYWADEGDTIKVHGWIEHAYGRPITEIDSLNLRFTMSDDSVTALNPSYHGACLQCESAICLMDGIDLEQECYVLGTITFNPKFKVLGPGDFNSCVYPLYAIRVVNIENKN